MWDAMVASMPRSAKDVAKHAEGVARHAKDGLGRCKHAQDVAKHALGTHNSNLLFMKHEF